MAYLVSYTVYSNVYVQLEFRVLRHGTFETLEMTLEMRVISDKTR